MNWGAQTFPIPLKRKKQHYCLVAGRALYGKIYSKFDNFASFQNLECEPDTS
jgi:hypothetical protein